MSYDLTEKEAKFVEYYCTEANGVAAEAARLAGYSDSVARKGSSILQKPHIAQAIDDWRENRQTHFRISPNQILERMWEEANFFGDGATHAGRINALVNLGKQLGLFEQKKMENAKNVGNTYNIINYKDADPMVDRVVDEIKRNEPEVIHELEHQAQIEVKDYSN